MYPLKNMVDPVGINAHHILEVHTAESGRWWISAIPFESSNGVERVKRVVRQDREFENVAVRSAVNRLPMSLLVRLRIRGADRPTRRVAAGGRWRWWRRVH